MIKRVCEKLHTFKVINISILSNIFSTPPPRILESEK